MGPNPIVASFYLKYPGLFANNFELALEQSDGTVRDVPTLSEAKQFG